jgi:hypothetical protein
MAEGRYIAYYRVSSAEQGRSGLGLEVQQAAVRAYRKRCSGTLRLSAPQDEWSGCQFHGISSSMRF